VDFEIDGCFEELEGSHNKQNIEVIEHHWEKCIEVTGNFIEK